MARCEAEQAACVEHIQKIIITAIPAYVPYIRMYLLFLNDLITDSLNTSLAHITTFHQVLGKLDWFKGFVQPLIK